MNNIECKCGNKNVTKIGNISTEVYYLPFTDDLGEHYHDYNSKSAEYKCSNGHTFYKKFTVKCPNPRCNWEG